MIPRVYVDTNVFIAAFEAAGAPIEYAWQVLGSVENASVEGITSELTLAELLSKPPETAPELMSTYQAVLSDRPDLGVRPVTRSVLIAAARVRMASPGVKLPDAIHLATSPPRHRAGRGLHAFRQRGSAPAEGLRLQARSPRPELPRRSREPIVILPLLQVRDLFITFFPRLYCHPGVRDAFDPRKTFR